MKTFKYAIVFISGVTVGIGYCGTKILKYSTDKGYLQRAMADAVMDKLDNAIHGDRRKGLMDRILFSTKEGAELTLDKIENKIETYAYMSVQELYDIIGVTKYKERSDKVGWTDSSVFRIRRLDGGYALMFPNPINLE